MAEISNIQDKYIRYIDSIIANHRISHAYLVEVNNYDQDIEVKIDFICDGDNYEGIYVIVLMRI